MKKIIGAMRYYDEKTRSCIITLPTVDFFNFIKSKNYLSLLSQGIVDTIWFDEQLERYDIILTSIPMFEEKK